MISQIPSLLLKWVDYFGGLDPYENLFHHFLFSVLLVVHDVNLPHFMPVFQTGSSEWPVFWLDSPPCLCHYEQWPYRSESACEETVMNWWRLFQGFWAYPSPFLSLGSHSHLCLAFSPIKTHFPEKIWLSHHTVIYKPWCAVIPRCIWILTPD